MSRGREVVGQCAGLAGSGLVRTEACRRACRDAPGFALAGLAGCEVVAGLSAAARNAVVPGEMRCDDLSTSADVATLGQRVEGAYGDRLWWGSWPGGVGATIVKSPKRQGMRVLGR